jgi:hypothetical protein
MREKTVCHAVSARPVHASARNRPKDIIIVTPVCKNFHSYKTQQYTAGFLTYIMDTVREEWLQRLQHVLSGGFKFIHVVFLQNAGTPIPDYLVS